MANKADWVAEYEAGWSAALDELVSDGIQAKLVGIAAPVQLKGQLSTGKPFYFRCRWNECSLAIGGADPADIPEWHREVTRENASYLPPQEAMAVLRELLDLYESQ